MKSFFETLLIIAFMAAKGVFLIAIMPPKKYKENLTQTAYE